MDIDVALICLSHADANTELAEDLLLHGARVLGKPVSISMVERPFYAPLLVITNRS